MDKKEQLEQLVSNPAFVAESQNVNSIDDLIALYNKYGVEVTAGDIAGMSKAFAFAKKTEEVKAKYASDKTKRDNTKAFIAILVVGIIIFLTGVPKTIRCTESTGAVVVAVDEEAVEHSRSHGQNITATVYRPVIEYEVDGVIFDEQWGTWTNLKSYHTGERVSVRYNPSEPSDFVLDKLGGFTLANLFGLAMAVFAGIGLVLKKIRK